MISFYFYYIEQNAIDLCVYTVGLDLSVTARATTKCRSVRSDAVGIGQTQIITIITNNNL